MSTIKAKQINIGDLADNFSSWLAANLLDRQNFSNAALNRYNQELFKAADSDLTSGETDLLIAAGGPINYFLIYRYKLKQIEIEDYTIAVDGSYNYTISFVTPFDNSGNEIIEVIYFTI